jgi:molybdopterin converting factor small subunit
MIRVTCVGHIRTSVGREMVELKEDRIKTSVLIERLREMGRDDPNLGFSKFNTLVIVNGSSAFTAAADDRMIDDGDEVLLLPFSHGG